MPEKFRFLPHTADIKFQAFGKTLDEAFENSALALFKSMYRGNIKKTKKQKISVQGNDLNSLLYNFLEELLFLLDSKGMFLSSVKVDIDRQKLELNGEIFWDHANNYKIESDVKAVTYNSMFVKRAGDKWVCQVVLDV